MSIKRFLMPLLGMLCLCLMLLLGESVKMMLLPIDNDIIRTVSLLLQATCWVYGIVSFVLSMEYAFDF